MRHKAATMTSVPWLSSALPRHLTSARRIAEQTAQIRELRSQVKELRSQAEILTGQLAHRDKVIAELESLAGRPYPLILESYRKARAQYKVTRHR